MSLVQDCLCAGKTWYVMSCSNAREVRESNFDHFGSSVRLEQTCLCAGKT